MLLLAGPPLIEAQSRPRRTAVKRRTSPVARIARRPLQEELGDGRARVAEQIKILSRFNYLFGRISSGIENNETQAQGNEVSAAAEEIIVKNKAALRETLRNVRAGIDELESHFETTSALKGFSTRLAYAGLSIDAAERSAEADRFDEAGRELLNVINRLTDLLLEMN